MKALKIIDAGLLSTIQDLGRFGYQRYGVSASGVMDEFSAKISNILVGNPFDAAVIETTLKGASFEVLADISIAVTGADTDLFINNEKVELWRTHKVKVGDSVRMGFSKNGLRNYISFSGGIDTPLVMKSRSTNLKGKFGGYQGRKLQVGDELDILPSENRATLIFNKELIPIFEKNIEIGVILGQQLDSFTKKGIETFLSNEYTVTAESDRMGIRVSGEAVEHITGADIISDGISFGAIQVPGNGQPIIMMADRQTTGGYTKIGNVITTDLSKLAQATPGTKIQFKEYSLEKAVEKYKEFSNNISNKNNYIDLNIGNSSNTDSCPNEENNPNLKKYVVKVNGKVYEVAVEIL